MEKLLIKSGRNYHFINKSEISLIRAERNYSRIICDKRNYVVRRSLQSLEEKLGEEKFMRINRSTIVNVDRIDEMREAENSGYVIVMNNQKVLTWGRRYRERLVRLVRI